MAVDTTELSRLTNPRFAAIVGEAIVRVSIVGREVLSLNSLVSSKVFNLKYSPQKDDLVVNSNCFDGITSGNVGADGKVEINPRNIGKVSEVYPLKNGIIVTYDVDDNNGDRIESLRLDEPYWVPVSLIGSIVGSNLVLRKDLADRLVISEAPEEREKKASTRNRIREFLRSSEFFGFIGKIRDISTNSDDKFEEAVSAFKAFETRRMNTLLGPREKVNVDQLKAGQTIAYIRQEKDEEDKFLIREFVGITTPDKKKRFVLYREVKPSHKIVDDIEKTILMRGDDVVLPYNDSNFYLGIGKVYRNFEAIEEGHNGVVSEMARINTVIKRLLAQHLGVSLEEA